MIDDLTYISEGVTELDEVALAMADFVNGLHDGHWSLYDQMVSDIVDSDDPAWLFEEMSDIILTHGYQFGTLPEDATTYVATPIQ